MDHAVLPRSLIIVCLALLLVVTFSGTVISVPSTERESPSVSPVTYRSALPAAAPVAKERPSVGSGSIAYSESAGDPLTREQEALLLTYMNLYYQSLSDLSAKDPSSLFASSAADQAEARKNAWETMIAVRTLQDSDLTLTAFSYEALISAINTGENGDIEVTATEYSLQNFTAFPGISSESWNTRHRFTLTEEDGQWKLLSHSQMDMANMLAAGRWPRSSSEGTGESRRESLLADHRKHLETRRYQAADYASDAFSDYSWDYAYDRQAAVAYACDWAGERNTASWPTYDRNGGNCQNYTSQCLLAGGIPMDYSGSSQWKWYGDSPSSSQSAAGRSASWSSVTEFYRYASSNTGYGLVAETDADFWSGEEGDLIQLGYQDNWRHVVIISEVIRDGNGNALDYLICSNTADLRNYPVSAYLYPQQRLIKIYGWNS